MYQSANEGNFKNWYLTTESLRNKSVNFILWKGGQEKVQKGEETQQMSPGLVVSI